MESGGGGCVGHVGWENVEEVDKAEEGVLEGGGSGNFRVLSESKVVVVFV